MSQTCHAHNCRAVQKNVTHPIIPTNLTHGAVKCYTALAAVIGSIAAVLVSSPRNIARRDGRVVECGRLENG